MKLNLCESIRRLRRGCDMTQEAVADALGVTYQAVSRWETGQSYPDIELLPSIAALFGVDMDVLFGMDPENLDEQIRKFNDEMDDAPDVDTQIAIAKRYDEAYPSAVRFKRALLSCYVEKGKDFTDKHLPEMRRLCQFVVDHSEETDWQRDFALEKMICAEEDGETERWLNLLDRQSSVHSEDALKQRYDFRGEVETFNRFIQGDTLNSFNRCFADNFCKRSRESYKVASSRMEGQRVILRVIDAMRDTTTEEDGWLCDRIFWYTRLAAGCFGCGENEAGYAALDRAADLAEIFAAIPDGTVLSYNCAALDELSYTVGEVDKRDLIECRLLFPLTTYGGWEWFNGVRDEERYISVCDRVRNIVEKI